MKNNIIVNLLMEISAMIIIIVISIPIWNKLDNNEMHEIANYYDNYYYIDFDIQNNEYGKMITIYNNSNTLEHYNLVMKINENYLELQDSYLFSTIAKKLEEYKKENPEKEIIKMGIGDVTRPIVPNVIEAMHKAVEEMQMQDILQMA